MVEYAVCVPLFAGGTDSTPACGQDLGGARMRATVYQSKMVDGTIVLTDDHSADVEVVLLFTGDGFKGEEAFGKPYGPDDYLPMMNRKGKDFIEDYLEGFRDPPGGQWTRQTREAVELAEGFLGVERT